MQANMPPPPSSILLIFSSRELSLPPFLLARLFALDICPCGGICVLNAPSSHGSLLSGRAVAGKDIPLSAKRFVSLAPHAGARRTRLSYQPPQVGSKAVQLGRPQQPNASKCPRVNRAVKLRTVRFTLAPRLHRNYFVPLSGR
jgi:hypothetical protein